MSAKLLYSLTDENPDLHKQIGCMNGFFQIFDRHHFPTGRRVKAQKMLPPVPDQSGNHGVEPNSALEKAAERNAKKVAKEKQRISTESSRTSFSSSSCSSSFSSLDCNRITQLEPSSYGQNTFPEKQSRDFPMNQSNASLQSRPQSLDLRDIVKDSVYREARALSVKTETKEAQGHIFKHIDSPRPLQLPKSVKQRNSCLSESCQGATMLQQAPLSSRVEEDGSRLLITRDAPRFSFDGRESRDTFKSLKIKELPRLSLDSRESTIRATAREMKSNYFSQDLQVKIMNSNITPNSHQELGSYKRPSSVVAKLMGLQAFPDATSTNENQTGLIKTCPEKVVDSISRSSRTLDESKQNHMLGSPRNSHRDSNSPRMRNADSVTKSTTSSKFPIEPAPWKQTDGRRGSQVPSLKHKEVNTKASNSSASVYGEIEKRLADIEFKKSGKDLRALKRILEAMQKTKEMLEIRKDNQAPDLASQTGSKSSPCQSSKLSNQRNPESSISTIIKGTSSPRSSKSPIVIMKPARLVERASSIASTDSISGAHKFQTDSRKESVDRKTKDPTQRSNPFRGSPSSTLHSVDISTRATTSRSIQTLKMPRHITGENTTISGKSSGTVSPRLQQKKLELEKQSRTTTLSDSSRTRRQLGRQPIELGSPGRKLKPNSSTSQQSNNLLKKTSRNMSNLRNHGDDISQQSESSISSASHTDAEASSTNGSDKNNSTFFPHHGLKQKNQGADFIADIAVAEPAAVTLEQPSPISVLDAKFYRDESPSPVKKITNAFKADDEASNSDEAEWTSVDLNHLPQTTTANLSSENDHNKSENIQHLVSNLGQDESIINYIAAQCEHSNPDHIYISKILLASGLLRGLDSGTTTMPFHPSGHPINPNLFLAVEQTKASTRLSNEHISRNTSHTKSDQKIQRKLIFDAVNEILGHKLVPEGSSQQWFSPYKLAGGRLRGQQLLKELCAEIDQLQTNKSSCSSGDEDDLLTSILWEDLTHQSANWSDYWSEISGLVLDIERLIFKDLINEVVNGETAGLQTYPGGYCRQLFSK